MRGRILMLLAMLMTATVAGCVSETPAECEAGVDCDTDEPTPPEDPAFPPPRDGNLTLPNVTYPSFQAADCVRYMAWLELPREQLRSVVPIEFEVSGLSDTTGRTLLNIFECARTVDNDTIYGAATLYLPFVRVHPVNSSWTTDGKLDFYLVDIAVDNAELGEVMNNVSMPVAVGEFVRTRTPQVGDAFAATLSIETEEWTHSLDFPFPDIEDGPTVKRAFHLWYGEGPFHRIDLRFNETSETLTPSTGTFRVDGQSALQDAMPTPAAPAILTYTVQIDTLFQYDGAWTKE